MSLFAASDGGAGHLEVSRGVRRRLHAQRVAERVAPKRNEHAMLREAQHKEERKPRKGRVQRVGVQHEVGQHDGQVERLEGRQVRKVAQADEDAVECHREAAKERGHRHRQAQRVERGDHRRVRGEERKGREVEHQHQRAGKGGADSEHGARLDRHLPRKIYARWKARKQRLGGHRQRLWEEGEEPHELEPDLERCRGQRAQRDSRTRRERVHAHDAQQPRDHHTGDAEERRELRARGHAPHERQAGAVALP
mmetsp:Transcript_2687/g.8060  ORF Transcript_2687/g.8060 Transcript_2687/m.8060 type:complete len:252 (-) Transcript_2687:654-1409(-)